MSNTKVSLRQKKISKGRLSLYLDFYPPIPHPQTGKPTRREFLGMYILEKPRTDLDRTNNKATKQLAEQVRAKRQLEIQAGKYGFLDRTKGQESFLAYFEKLSREREGSNRDNWHSTLNYLQAFTNNHCTFKDITEAFCQDFLKYLQTATTRTSKTKKLSENSIYSYFNKFKAGVNRAFEEKLLEENPARRIKLKQPETHREFLTLEELQVLAQTDCEPEVLKRAAIFSALTGVRWSDIHALTWAQVQHSESQGYFIRFIQKKTKGAETLPISDQAFELMGERGEPKEKVFTGLKYSAWTNLRLKQWVIS
ncbi:MAG: site-specific integrase, partial [Bacteroidota bacterium]